MATELTFSEMYQLGRPVLSLEFFPPKQPTGVGDTEQLIRRLADCGPDFVTVTYGAGGGTRSMTRHLVRYIRNALALPAVAHLTCVGHTREEINFLLDDYKSEGVRYILALRGDPPKGEMTFTPTAKGLRNACELAAFIRARGDFRIAVAGYPEVHRDALSPDADIHYLREKVEAGGEVVLTQLFFDPEVYFRFVERCRAAGIQAPIVPGVMPIANVSQIQRFTTLCGATVPRALQSKLETFADRPEDVVKFGVEYAINQCSSLLRGGAPGIHLYTLNRSTQIEPIVAALRSGAGLEAHATA